MPETKTEVMKLGANMSDEARAELEATLEHVKKNTETTDEETSKVEEPVEKDPCPRCGFKDGKPQPEQADIEEYMRSTLGGRRFTKTYDIMKGQIKLTFATVDTAGSEKMNDLINKLTAVEDPVVFRGLLTKLQLVYFLKEYQIGSEKVTMEEPQCETPDELSAAFISRFGSLDESVATMFSRAMNSFVALKTALVESCFDEAFYKGAGPF